MMGLVMTPTSRPGIVTLNRPIHPFENLGGY